MTGKLVDEDPIVTKAREAATAVIQAARTRQAKRKSSTLDGSGITVTGGKCYSAADVIALKARKTAKEEAAAMSKMVNATVAEAQRCQDDECSKICKGGKDWVHCDTCLAFFVCSTCHRADKSLLVSHDEICACPGDTNPLIDSMEVDSHRSPRVRAARRRS